MKSHYGYDAPEIIKRMGLFGTIALITTIIFTLYLPQGWISLLVVSAMIVLTASLFIPAITIFFGSIYFKFLERYWLFSNLVLQGNEAVLDVGCGHGLLMIGAAKRLTTGKVYGLDLWVQADQSNNSQEATLLNASIEGVADKVEVSSGDMRKLPFSDASMDVIISSWAIHNIYDQAGREAALSEIVRTLKPGGRIAILGINYGSVAKINLSHKKPYTLDFQHPMLPTQINFGRNCSA